MTIKKSSSTEGLHAFYAYIGLAVDYYKRKKEWTNKDLGIQVNVSETFIKKANTGIRHYSASRIWTIAKMLDVPVSNLYQPTIKDEKGFKKYHEIYTYASKDDFNRFMDLLNEDL